MVLPTHSHRRSSNRDDYCTKMSSCKTNLSSSSALSILTLRNDKSKYSQIPFWSLPNVQPTYYCVCFVCCVLALEYYDVLRKRTNLVTRAGFNGDLEIQGDTTVSRCHAKLSLFKIVPTYLLVSNMFSSNPNCFTLSFVFLGSR